MCESYEAFVKGKCSNCNRDGHFCIKFGFHSRPGFRRAMDRGYLQLIQSPIATYLLTTDKEPFCAAHFKVTVVISSNILNQIKLEHQQCNCIFRLGGKPSAWRRDWRFVFHIHWKPQTGLEQDSVQPDANLLQTCK